MRARYVVVLAVLLSMACGGDPGSAPAPTEEAVAPQAEPGDTPATTATSSAGGGGGEGSMADFFGYDEAHTEAQQADFRDQESRIQEAIRVCMAEQGFEYQPMVPPDDAFQVWDETDEEERVRTQGFGVTTWYGNEEEFGGGEEWVDPNQDMLDAMSESERQAWHDALYGSMEDQEAAMTTEVDPETGEAIYTSAGFGFGCQGEAYESEYGEQGDTQALWEDLQPTMDAMYQRVEADPRIVDSNEEWAACMETAGYEVTFRNEMYETVHQDFQTRLDEIIGTEGSQDPFEGMTEEEINAFFEEKTQEEIDAFFAAAEEESRANVDMDAVAALQQEEIDMAVADFDCGQGLNELYQEVSEEYEAEFIAENRAVLEEIRELEGG